MLRMRGVNAPSQQDQTVEYAKEVISHLKGYGLTDKQIGIRLDMTRRQVINIKQTGFKRFTTQVAFERLAGMR
jgi:DNA-binding CsgD family transcriptional regulator